MCIKNVYQSKGLDHCREMQLQAWYHFDELPRGEEKTFDECLIFVIERHRRAVEKEIRRLEIEESLDYAG